VSDSIIGEGFRQRRFSDDFAKLLRARILSGELDAGQRLNEVQLSKEYGISRSPIREALQGLAGEGLVQFIAGKGAFIGGLTVADARDLGGVREALETHAVGIVVDRLDAENLAMLRASVDVLEGSYADDVDRFDFHGTILRLSGNPQLEHHAASVTAHLRLARSRSAATTGRLAEAGGEHRKILAAIERGDRRAAVEAMRSHIQRATQNACTALEWVEASRRRAQHSGSSGA
jgi:GntR family transcriptional regulator, rspAB operon transcriptional repressor